MAEDCAAMAELAHALQLQLSIRLRIDWVDSDSNPADGLSRDGISDAWTLAQQYRLAEVPSEGLPRADAGICVAGAAGYYIGVAAGDKK